MSKVSLSELFHTYYPAVLICERSVYTGNENKTVIGDIFTGIGMGALMLVKVPMLVLKELGFFSYPYDYVNQVIEYEKEVRDQYSPDYQTKRYKRDHPY